MQVCQNNDKQMHITEQRATRPLLITCPQYTWHLSQLVLHDMKCETHMGCLTDLWDNTRTFGMGGVCHMTLAMSCHWQLATDKHANSITDCSITGWQLTVKPRICKSQQHATTGHHLQNPCMLKESSGERLVQSIIHNTLTALTNSTKHTEGSIGLSEWRSLKRSKWYRHIWAFYSRPLGKPQNCSKVAM